METGKIFLLFCLLFISTTPIRGENEKDKEDYPGDDDESFLSDSETNEQPVIITLPVVRDVLEGESVELECKTEKPTQFAVMWKRPQDGANYISLDDYVTQTYQGRFEIQEKGLVLKIKNINATDAGKYVCQISSDTQPKLIHTIYVREKGSPPKPPRLTLFPEGTKVINQSDDLNLTCNVMSEGKQEEFKWQKKDTKDGKPHMHLSTSINRVSERISTNTLMLKSIQRQDAGEYACIFKDEIGSAESVVKVEVNFPPYIITKQDSVHSDIGKAVELSCAAFGQPIPTLTWYRDTQPSPVQLRQSGGYEIENSQNNDTSRLTIKNVTSRDYGDYICEASSQGFENATTKIHVTGNPSQPIIVPEKTKLGQQHMSYDLVWKVDSSFKIDEGKVKYRKVSGDAPTNWTTEQVQAVPLTNQPNSYEVMFTLRNLTSSSKYEATLSTKSEKGWSQEARIHQFDINGKNYQSPEASKANGKDSIFQGGSQTVVTFSLFLMLIMNGVGRWI